MAGATAEVAQAVGAALTEHGWQVDVLPITAVNGLEGYAGVVLGAPMILGWHRGALGFLRRHRAALQRVPLAVFALAMRLTQPAERMVNGVRVTVDEALPTPPAAPGRLNFKERYAQLANYVGPIVRAAGPERPAALAVFGGRMEYGRLPWWAVLFAMLVIQAPAGDRRNWSASAWAASLPAAFHLAVPAAPDTPQPIAEVGVPIG
jgi:menaquinone-dependent protoporphyrinogen IX oxidase